MLFVVATPIGNLEDMTPRAVRVLKEADIIATEDTRHSRVLLARFEITNVPVFSCHKFNEEKRGDFFVSKMLEGKSVALISDAGTPCISDPGYRLVRAAADAGIPVIAVCGASAVVAALSVSGFDVSQFQFLGFLPRKKGELVDCLGAALPGTIVFYESPRRIAATLSLIAEIYPLAELCVCNDISKKFERLYRGTAMDVLAQIEENPSAEKGEYTCVMNLEKMPEEQMSEDDDAPSIEARLVDIMVKSGGTLKDAAEKLREGYDSPKQLKQKLSKKEIYKAMLVLKNLLGAGIDSDE